MFVLFTEDSEGVFLRGVSDSLADFSVKMGIGADEWSRHDSGGVIFYEYLPMTDTPQCYVAYWVNPADPGLVDIPVALDDSVLDA